MSEWLPSPRWIRVRLGETWVADTKRAMLLRQHGFLPVYYFPESDVRTDLLEPVDYTTFSPYKGTARYFDLRAGAQVARYAVWTYPDPKPGSPDTRGYYGFDWHSMDEWQEEAERLHVHARDPFLRVDAVRSSREVRVEIAGVTVAETRRPVLLFETGLVTRYYVPPEDVRSDLLRPGSTSRMCPYKGRARSHHVDVDGALVEDAAWEYQRPLPAVAEVAGHLCFWSERDDTTIVIDGLPLERLGTRESGDGGELLPPSRVFWSEPPPASMRGASAGERQHDFARPNRRAEGPPDDVMDLAVERAGGRPGEWLT